MEACDRCGEAPENVDGVVLTPLVRRGGRKICPACDHVLTDGTALVGTARIPIFAGSGA